MSEEEARKYAVKLMALQGELEDDDYFEDLEAANQTDSE